MRWTISRPGQMTIEYKANSAREKSPLPESPNRELQGRRPSFNGKPISRGFCSCFYCILLYTSFSIFHSCTKTISYAPLCFRLCTSTLLLPLLEHRLSSYFAFAWFNCCSFPPFELRGVSSSFIPPVPVWRRPSPRRRRPMARGPVDPFTLTLFKQLGWKGFGRDKA